MFRAPRAAAPAVALAVLLAGCSGDPSDDPVPEESRTSATGAVPASDGIAATTPPSGTEAPGRVGTSPPGPSASGSTAGASSRTRPPVGIPGGIPGAEPLTAVTEAALLALLTAEGEAGGQAYRIGPAAGEGWVVTVRVFDGARDVEVSPDGATVRSVTETTAGPETAALEITRVLVAEGAEVAVAEAPGDLRSAVLVQDGDRAYWDVSVDTADGRRRVRVDVATGERF